MNICKNCGTHFDSKFCPNCGFPVKVNRIDKHYVVHEIQHGLFHMEKGFLYTTKELLIRPGHTVRRFIEGNRVKHYKPIGFVIICSIIYTVISHYFGQENKLENLEGGIQKVFQWITDNYQYSNLIEIIFIALSLNLLFKKKAYNYFEHVVLLCYLTGFAMLIGGLCITLSALSNSEIFNSLFPLLSIGYTVWAIGQFYSENDWFIYFKSLVAYMIGFSLFLIAAILVGVLLDVFTNNL